MRWTGSSCKPQPDLSLKTSILGEALTTVRFCLGFVPRKNFLAGWMRHEGSVPVKGKQVQLLYVLVHFFVQWSAFLIRVWNAQACSIIYIDDPLKHSIYGLQGSPQLSVMRTKTNSSVACWSSLIRSNVRGWIGITLYQERSRGRDIYRVNYLFGLDLSWPM